MAIAGQIEYQVSVDTSGLKKGLNEAKKETSAFASNLVSIGKTGAKVFAGTLVAGAVAGAGAIAGLAGSAVRAYADFEQLKGGVETLFKDSADTIMQYAQDAYKTAGLSANEYMEQATSFSASLLQSLNGDTEQASKITDMAIQDMADNMNKMGSSMESIQHAYQGFAKQNYTMLDNLKLGYGGTKTEMERLLADATKLTGVKYDINNLDDVFSAIHAIQTQMGITGTTAKEAMATISGSLNMTKSAWSNLIAGMADDNANFDELVNNLMESVSALAKNLIPRIGTALKGAVKAIGAIVPEIAKMLPNLLQQLLPAIIQATQMLLKALVDALPVVLQVLVESVPMLVQSILDIIQGIIDALPTIIDAVMQILLAIITALYSPDALSAMLKACITLFMTIVKAIPQIITALIDALPTIIESIVAFLTDPENIKMLIVASVELFMALVKAVPQILGALFSAFGKLFGDLWVKLQQMFSEFAGKFGDKIASVFKGAINKVLEFIENFINAPINIINGFVDTINSAFGSVGVNIGKIGRVNLGRMATGGIVPSTNGGQLILAGEGGQDEWVVPESKMASMIQKINEQGGTGGGITINIQGVFATSDQEQRAVAEQIYDKLQEINKTRMGVYL